METAATGEDNSASITKRSAVDNANREDILNRISLLGMYGDNTSYIGTACSGL